MKEDDAFTGRAARHEFQARELDREVSGPPMIRMLLASLAAGILFGLGVALTGATEPVATLAVGCFFALAVLAIVAALYSGGRVAAFLGRRRSGQ